MSETDPLVAAFFDSYRAAFEGLNAAAIADHFAHPGHVTSDAGEIGLVVVASRRDWLGALERLLAMYRGIGLRSARILKLQTTALSPRLFQANVHWELHGVSGRLYDFDAAYTLALVDGALRVCTIAHNEIPRYRAYLATRKLTPGEDSIP